MAAEKTTTPAPPPPEPAKLAPAGASHDPAVHQILAERQTALANGDTAAAVVADARLREIGYG